MRFRRWLQCERFLEGLNEDQLLAFARHGYLPEPLPEPLPMGKSRLDGLDRKSLTKLWRESERILAGRSKEELRLYATHGHWPEQACDGEKCLEFDGRVRRLEASAHGGSV